MMNKTELRAAAARLLYNDNRDTSDYNMLIDFIDNYFDNQQPTTDGWIPCKIYHRLTKKSDDTTHTNKVCCTHFKNEECQEVEGNCSAGCFWEEYVWERLEHFEELAEQGRLAYLLQPYKESE